MKLTERDVEVLGMLRFGVIDADKLYRMFFIKMSKDADERFGKSIDTRRSEASINRSALIEYATAKAVAAVSCLNGDDVSGIEAELMSLSAEVKGKQKDMSSFASGIRRLSGGVSAIVKTDVIQGLNEKNRLEKLSSIIGDRMEKIARESLQGIEVRKLKMRGRRAVVRMIDAGLIREYKVNELSKTNIYYQLTELGASVATSQIEDGATFLDRDMIRCKRVPRASLIHEDAVSGVMRSLFYHSSAQGYFIDYMYDESALKRVFGRRKGKVYPDVQVRIKAAGPKGGIKIYNIEVDNATQPTRILQRKISKEYPLIILCLSADRGNMLYKRLSVVSGNEDGFLVGNQREFVRNGIYKVSLLAPPDGQLVNIGRPRSM